MAEWQRLRAALPVRVEIVHNYTSARHYGHYVQGVDHIMVREPLAVGRLRRAAGQPLCWTPSRAKNLMSFSDGYEDRWPEQGVHHHRRADRTATTRVERSSGNNVVYHRA